MSGNARNFRHIDSGQHRCIKQMVQCHSGLPSLYATGYFRISTNLSGLKVDYNDNTNTDFSKIGLFIAHINKFQRELCPSVCFTKSVEIWVYGLLTNQLHKVMQLEKVKCFRHMPTQIGEIWFCWMNVTQEFLILSSAAQQCNPFHSEPSALALQKDFVPSCMFCCNC